MSDSWQDRAAAIRAAIEVARAPLVERGALVELMALAAVAGEHLLVIGPPGTAKSAAVRRMANALGGQFFEYLIGRFTEPGELFGPVNLQRLREGVVETETTGMLPEAEIAFLDEVFLGSTAILNTLLGILNERVFRRGHTIRVCPLRVCVGASNGLPEEGHLAAMADRFLLRLFVAPVADPMLENLLEAGWRGEGDAVTARASMEDLRILSDVARQADLNPVRPQLAEALRLLRTHGIHLSDRRMVKTQKLIAAAAVLDGRAQPGTQDLWPLIFVVPDAATQLRARELLRELLEQSQNQTASSAAELASLGPLARAQRMGHLAQALLQDIPEVGTSREPWLRRLEGIAREIDACFAPENLPEQLGALRKQIASHLEVG